MVRYDSHGRVINVLLNFIKDKEQYLDLSSNLFYLLRSTCIVSGAHVGSELDHPVEQRAAVVLHRVHQRRHPRRLQMKNLPRKITSPYDPFTIVRPSRVYLKFPIKVFREYVPLQMDLFCPSKV